MSRPIPTIEAVAEVRWRLHSKPIRRHVVLTDTREEFAGPAEMLSRAFEGGDVPVVADCDLPEGHLGVTTPNPTVRPALLGFDAENEGMGVPAFLSVVMQRDIAHHSVPRRNRSASGDALCCGLLLDLPESLHQLPVANEEPFLQVLVALSDLPIVPIHLCRGYRQGSNHYGSADAKDPAKQRRKDQLHRAIISTATAPRPGPKT